MGNKILLLDLIIRAMFIPNTEVVNMFTTKNLKTI